MIIANSAPRWLSIISYPTRAHGIIVNYNPPINFRVILLATNTNSPDSYQAITPTRVDICPPIVSVEEKPSQHKNFNFSSVLFRMEGNQTSVIEFSDGDIKKLMASAFPESTKKSLKYAVNVFEGGVSHE